MNPQVLQTQTKMKIFLTSGFPAVAGQAM